MPTLPADALLGPRPNRVAIRRALLSVSNKTGLAGLATALHQLGVQLISTGGTAAALREAGLPVTPVEDITKFPEMLDGRVKTLHPAVHGGLLARRDRDDQMTALAAAGFEPIDLLVVNLYPFVETLQKVGVGYQEVIEHIDIGGPAMLRAAAKNNDGVAAVVDPDDYNSLISELEAHGSLGFAFRQTLAAKAFAHTAAYDGAIANFLTGLPALTSAAAQANNTIEPQSPHEASALPRIFTLQVTQRQAMRYGENPHQSAAFYALSGAAPGCLGGYEQLQGRALSFNNLADADAAWSCVRSLTGPSCVIVKHANPCGVALGSSALEAYQRALATDPTSAFGGILAFNVALDGPAATAISSQFAEVIIAPSYSQAALAVFAAKQNLRLLTVPLGQETAISSGLDIKRISGGLLLQTPDRNTLVAADFRCVTHQQPSAQQIDDLLFAWKVATWVKSNAIVFCRSGQTLGVGAGQMSRLDSARIASIKAEQAGLSLQGAVVASDAFFPFRDGLDVVADAGAAAVVQPGGSVRDDEVIAAANERGIAMVYTGMRHFRH